jgi:hypothetical protein
MVEIPDDVLAAFGVPKLPSIVFGDVFLLKPPHARYFDAHYERTAIVMRAQTATNGEAAMVHLFCTTSAGSPCKDAVRCRCGEGGLFKDCWVDHRHYVKHLSAAILSQDCQLLGSLPPGRLAEIEAVLQHSSLSHVIKDLPN